MSVANSLRHGLWIFGLAVDDIFTIRLPPQTAVAEAVTQCAASAAANFAVLYRRATVGTLPIRRRSIISMQVFNAKSNQ